VERPAIAADVIVNPHSQPLTVHDTACGEGNLLMASRLPLSNTHRQKPSPAQVETTRAGA